MQNVNFRKNIIRFSIWKKIDFIFMGIPILLTKN